MFVSPVTPAPSSGAAHDTHAAAGHAPEHPDTHNKNETCKSYSLTFQCSLDHMYTGFSYIRLLSEKSISSRIEKMIVYQNDMEPMIK